MNKTITILQHEISYWYHPPQEMPDHEQNHVKSLIEQGYVAGQLIDTKGTGWWKIVRPEIKLDVNLEADHMFFIKKPDFPGGPTREIEVLGTIEMTNSKKLVAYRMILHKTAGDIKFLPKDNFKQRFSRYEKKES